MRFYVHSGNHGDGNGITDTILFLKNALQDCGHTAYISPRIEKDNVNIVMEHFIEEKHLQALIDGRNQGARFILIGTEPIVNGTFNGGIESKHWHYGNRDYWRVRFDAFAIAATMADAIWVLAESMVPGYTALFPNVPVRFLPHGHVNNFANIVHRPESERNIDFYFSGSLTAHRERILKDLARTHHVGLNNPGVGEYLRQDMLSRSKVCLSLRLSENNLIPSVSRMHHHLQNRSFMLHEAYPLPCVLDPFVLQASGADFCDWARAALEIPNRREIADGAYERFKEALPMTRLLPPLLEEALDHMQSSGPMPLARAA